MNFRIAKTLLALMALGFTCHVNILCADDWPQIDSVDRQPLMAAVERVITALDSVGRPLSAEQTETFEKLKQVDDDQKVIKEIQTLLDPLCLAAIHINPESRVKVAEGPAAKLLTQNGWTTFLLKVHNEAGINPALNGNSPQAKPQFIHCLLYTSDAADE